MLLSVTACIFLVFVFSAVCFSGEIDRCLKKVAEGVEQFEDIWQKVLFGWFVSLFLSVELFEIT